MLLRVEQDKGRKGSELRGLNLVDPDNPKAAEEPSDQRLAMPAAA
jgi:hypothetical protein